MRGRDRRPRIREGAARSDLPARERQYLLAVLDAPAEAREGSKAINRDGTYRLHREYLAQRMGVSVVTIRRIQRSLAKKGILHLRHEGKHGWPSTWQMHVPDPPIRRNTSLL